MHNEVVHDFLVAKDPLSSTPFQALAQTILIDYIGNISIILIIFPSSYKPPIITPLGT